MYKNIINVIIILIIFIIFIFFKKNNLRETFTTSYVIPNYALGNILSHYFYHIALAWRNNKRLIVRSNKSNNKLVKKLPKMVILKESCPDFIRNYNFGVVDKAGVSLWIHQDIWKYLIPIIYDTMSNISDLTIPSFDCVIHFRCSDIPFNRHKFYHLLKYEWYKKAINMCLKKQKINEIIILNCNTNYTRDSNNLCLKWGKDLGNYLYKYFKISYKILCNDVNEDFIIMKNSKCLISSGSSLSFFAGLSSKNLFIYPSTGTDYKIEKCHIMRNNSICIPKLFIKHNEVSDYKKLNKDLFII